MNTTPSEDTAPDESTMRDEYDFHGGFRGKHARAYRQGHTVTIHQADGSTLVREHQPGEGSIMLDPDVRVYFPDEEKVNRTLRTLIGLVPRREMPIPHAEASTS